MIADTWTLLGWDIDDRLNHQTNISQIGNDLLLLNIFFKLPNLCFWTFLSNGNLMFKYVNLKFYTVNLKFINVNVIFIASLFILVLVFFCYFIHCYDYTFEIEDRKYFSAKWKGEVVVWYIIFCFNGLVKNVFLIILK